MSLHPHHREPIREPQSEPHRTRLPIIPDLRFEFSYLRSVSPYVHVNRGKGSEETLKDERRPEDDGEWKVIEGRRKSSEKTKRKQREIPSPPPEIHIDWRRVAWVTTRDQVVSPMLQGALWGVASHFLRPLTSLLGFHIRKLFSTHLSPPGEGLGVGWLRSWVRNLGLGTST